VDISPHSLGIGMKKDQRRKRRRSKREKGRPEKVWKGREDVQRVPEKGG